MQLMRLKDVPAQEDDQEEGRTMSSSSTSRCTPQVCVLEMRVLLKVILSPSYSHSAHLVMFARLLRGGTWISSDLALKD
eukprot:593636-Amphidinium_carterae.1